MKRAVATSAYFCLYWSLSGLPQGVAEDDLPVPDPASARLTDLGRYRVAYSSALQPLTINRMHAWIVHVASADGDPVEGARLTVSGGMPAHDHGLPTAPRVTADLGDGNYRVNGMKFHMGGAWEVVIDIAASEGRDSVTWVLDL